MIVLEILGILVAAYIIARVMREQDTEGGPRPQLSPRPDAGTAASSSPSVHPRLYDQEADQ